jgi:hypothetical protein
MNFDKFYYKIDVPYVHLNQLKKYALTAHYSYKNHQSLTFLPARYSDDPFLNAVKNKFGGDMFVFSHWPNMFYKWHVDLWAACNFNMLLDDYNSKTLFKVDTPNTDVINFTELKYEPNKCFLFNAQEPHCVMNFDNRNRLLLQWSIWKKGNEDLNNIYESVLDWYKNEYLKMSKM